MINGHRKSKHIQTGDIAPNSYNLEFMYQVQTVNRICIF